MQSVVPPHLTPNSPAPPHHLSNNAVQPQLQPNNNAVQLQHMTNNAVQPQYLVSNQPYLNQQMYPQQNYPGPQQGYLHPQPYNNPPSSMQSHMQQHPQQHPGLDRTTSYVLSQQQTGNIQQQTSNMQPGNMQPGNVQQQPRSPVPVAYPANNHLVYPNSPSGYLSM